MTYQRLVSVCSLVILTVIGASSTVRATVLMPADLAMMATDAQQIVRGRVIDIRSQMTGGRRTIETLVTVQVSDAIKGPAASQVTVRIPNGRVGRYQRVMVGAPEFQPGEELILFLRTRAPELPTIFGLNQGVYRIRSGTVQRRLLPVPEFVREIRVAMGAR